MKCFNVLQYQNAVHVHMRCQVPFQSDTWACFIFYFFAQVPNCWPISRGIPNDALQNPGLETPLCAAPGPGTRRFRLQPRCDPHFDSLTPKLCRYLNIFFMRTWGPGNVKAGYVNCAAGDFPDSPYISPWSLPSETQRNTTQLFTVVVSWSFCNWTKTSIKQMRTK